MNLETVLFDKDGFKFSRVQKNQYKMEFFMENKNIYLPKIINFDIINLIYELNKDIYEKVEIEKLNENEIISSIIIKHFFEDIGQPQRFLFIHMKKFEENFNNNKRFIFKSQTIKTHTIDNIPHGAVLLDILESTNIFDIMTPHKVKFTFNVILEEGTNIPLFVEKIVGTILHKIFKRVKQFIENIRI
jgi:hypothetical protein